MNRLLVLFIFVLQGCAPLVRNQVVGKTVSPGGAPKGSCERAHWIHIGATRSTVSYTKSLGSNGTYNFYQPMSLSVKSPGFYQADPVMGNRLSHMKIEAAFAQLESRRLESRHFRPVQGLLLRDSWSSNMIALSYVMMALGTIGVFVGLANIGNDPFEPIMGTSAGLLLGSAVPGITGLLLKPADNEMAKMWLYKQVLMDTDRAFIEDVVRATRRHNLRVRQECP